MTICNSLALSRNGARGFGRPSPAKIPGAYRAAPTRNDALAQPTAQHTAVVFDIGNVFIEWDPRHLFAGMFDGQARAMEWFLANVCTPDWNREQDRGRSWRDAVASLRTIYPEWREEIESYDRRWHETAPRAFDQTVAIFERLKAAGVPIYAITNFSHEKFAECRERFEFLGAFDGVIVSATEGLLKPDPAIYHVLLSRYGLEPAACIFIDDSHANVAAARDLGMTALAFADPHVLAEDLRRLGFEV
ncbi:MAG: HAD family phosphatase [Methylobacteriaceae bacterium]|nr:HAD family phosphatase [Methylobacteriaceae bacterium]